MGHGPERRFWLHHPPQGGAARARVLYLHPLAEEMNRSRRMAALQARALAAAGCEVLQPDLRGCGDSAGEFAEASWQGWIEDALEGCRWLQQRPGAAPLWLWGLRAGALLAAEVARALPSPAQLLLWQAPASGRIVLQQFLRLRLAQALCIKGEAATLMKSLRAQLDAGTPVEAAGYVLSPALARGLDAATLAPPAPAGRLVWLEVGGTEPGEVAPAAHPTLTAWRAAGWNVLAQRVPGPAFWVTAETETAPALLQASLQALLDEVPQ
ncbi:hydrolase 2, exosortase A system-associated [Azohydromonas caseinilytica]|uniref:Hydrolase 2, exosortase A system-associated n=1 Tax=Azohydromonas caseinilytica TaxID=2728836 RepID=A0A848FBR2_9BURK|nr:hydrolase 2, exosortase A system-associated [Azohydromonas caseinilytica]NML15630.1 hydrolase 2, exosortase A system-associated [Azohydromonas caseinilytica]